MMLKISLRFFLVLFFFPLVINIVPAFAISPTGTTVVGGSPTISPAPSGKLQICQAHENYIKIRLSHIQTLTTKELTDFDRIAARTESYYTTSILPKGKTVTNYAAFVVDIATKKTAALAAIAPMATDISGFSCSVADPKIVLTKFGTDLQGVRLALQAYRTSLKNLIVAVRSIRGTVYLDNQLTPKPSTIFSPTHMVNITASPTQ